MFKPPRLFFFCRLTQSTISVEVEAQCKQRQDERNTTNNDGKVFS